MTDFKVMKLLFEFFKVKHTPKKHQNDNVGWEIVESMHNIIPIATKMVIYVTKYLVIYNKMMMMNKESWINIHT